MLGVLAEVAKTGAIDSILVPYDSYFTLRESAYLACWMSMQHLKSSAIP